ncbi:hypothetical protein NQZ68_012903 [Dissostichus eleginoides]|nr:hypothetical protein NQZ68_012903 [Dissostichus eleginoides]
MASRFLLHAAFYLKAMLSQLSVPQSANAALALSTSQSSTFKECSAGPLSVNRGCVGHTAHLIRLLSTGQRAHRLKQTVSGCPTFISEIHHAGPANEDTGSRQKGNLQSVLGGGEPGGGQPSAQRLGLNAFKSRAAQGELLMWET